MTTIALKDGIIAYDSRLSEHDTILSDSFNKMFLRSGRAYFIAGDASPVECYEEVFEAHGLKTDFEWLEGKMFVVDTGAQVNVCVIMDGQLVSKIACSIKDVYAIGSGSDHALSVMDAGLSAERAVEITMIRDTGTGGFVSTYKIPQAYQ